MTTTTKAVSTRLNWAFAEGEEGEDIRADTTNSLKLQWDNRAVSIEDVRGREQDFTLDKQGFEFHNAPTSFKDFNNDDSIRAEYFKDVEALAKKV